MKTTKLKYFIINTIISIILPISLSIIIIYLYLDSNYNEIGLIIELIPWIFFNILINNINLIFKNPIFFFILPYILYYWIFIFIHHFIYKYNKEVLWYIFTIIISLINVYYWFKVYILMTS